MCAKLFTVNAKRENVAVTMGKRLGVQGRIDRGKSLKNIAVNADCMEQN